MKGLLSGCALALACNRKCVWPEKSKIAVLAQFCAWRGNPQRKRRIAAPSTRNCRRLIGGEVRLGESSTEP